MLVLIKYEEGEEMAHRIPDPDEILNLAQELKIAREKTAALQAQWNSFFTPSESSSATETRQASLQDRIVDLLDSTSDKTFTTATVTAILSANPNSVGPLLSRAVADGKIQRMSHGEYASLRHGVSAYLIDAFEKKESPDAKA